MTKRILVGVWLAGAMALAGCGEQVEAGVSGQRLGGAVTPASAPDGSSVVALAVGSSQHCVLRSTGGVWCWGSGQGALGDGVNEDRLTPTLPVLGLEGAVQVSSAAYHVCALRGDGTVACWSGPTQTPTGQAPVMAEISLPEPAVRLAGGHNESCAVLASGQVRCWSCFPGGGCSNSVDPDPIAFAGPVDQVATRGALICGRLASGHLSCPAVEGPGGTDAGMPWTARRAEVEAIGDVAEFGLGMEFGCLRQTGGQVLCWGDNTVGQLGRGTQSPVYGPNTVLPPAEERCHAPGPVLGLDDAVSLAVGTHHACAVRASGAVLCWGLNHAGQVGFPLGLTFETAGQTLDAQPTPVQVIEAGQGSALSVHASTSCALLADGGVTCWGWSGPYTRAETPTLIVSQ